MKWKKLDCDRDSRNTSDLTEVECSKRKMSTVFDEDGPCTIEELDNIITAPSGGLTMYPSNAYDEVCEGIFIGEGDSAKSLARMKRLGVTHVLNAALGKDAYHVNTNHVMYQRADIQFLGIEATDFINCDLSKHFAAASEFIEAAVQNGGKVFVHCVQGVSRSATLVLAYLMIKHHMTVQDALRMVRERREICPNPGFLQQLCNLNEQLKKSGHFDHRRKKFTPGENLQKELHRCSVAARFGGGGVVGGGEFVTGSTKPDINNDAKKGIPSCTVEELENILTEPSGGFMMMPDSQSSQINEHIFIGEGDFALKLERLQRLKITHVLNAAYNKGVNSDPDMYEKAAIKFLGVEAMDTMGFDMSPYWEVAADVIASAVTSKGRIFVHCVQGISRSAALVIAYFMIKQHMTVKDATRLVRGKREICPNSNFLQQLCHLDEKLRKSGHFGQKKPEVDT